MELIRMIGTVRAGKELVNESRCAPLRARRSRVTECMARSLLHISEHHTEISKHDVI